MQSNLKYNLRVYTECCQGGRQYMEDCHCVAYGKKMPSICSENTNGLPLIDNQIGVDYVYLGVFDGHGGKEAAIYTRDNLLKNVVSQRNFSSANDDLILTAIKDGFINTHYGMVKEVEKWPKTSSGLPSTSGTTASVCFIMNNKYYIGHVGDSKIVLGRKSEDATFWRHVPFTHDHKPDSPEERTRIENAGGKVIRKSGTERVVWNRPKSGHKGPIRRSTHFDEIPFLAVARSLGDLWSYNSARGVFVVSPEPDVSVIPINPEEDKCLILASDGLWNMITEEESVDILQRKEEKDSIQDMFHSVFNSEDFGALNCAQTLVHVALQRWCYHNLRADNTSVVVVFLEKASGDGSGADNAIVAQSICKPLVSEDAVFEEQLSALPEPTIISSSFGGEYYIDTSSVNANSITIHHDDRQEESAKWVSSENYLVPNCYDYNPIHMHSTFSLSDSFYCHPQSSALPATTPLKPLQSINDNGSNCKWEEEVNCSQTDKTNEGNCTKESLKSDDGSDELAPLLNISCNSVDCSNSENRNTGRCTDHDCGGIQAKMMKSICARNTDNRNKIKEGKVVKKRKLEPFLTRSPPSKRLRSSRWTRKVLPSVLNRVLAASLLTRSRLRAISCISKV